MFREERIEIRVCGDSCIVDGYYVFTNDIRQPLKQILVYPFPVDLGYQLPENIRVEDVTVGRSIEYSKEINSISFPISIPSNGRCTIHVQYVQSTPQQSIVYILTTTRLWNRPLSRAEYMIHIPPGFRATSMSLQGWKITKRGDSTIYELKRAQYMPGENLALSWKRSEQ